MTNLEKYKEVFGDDLNDSKVSGSWLCQTYNGPVKKTDREKFIEWLNNEPLVKFEEVTDEKFPRIYVTDLTNNPIIRVSDFDNKGHVYVGYEGIFGTLNIFKVKELIKKSVDIRINDYEARYYCKKHSRICKGCCDDFYFYAEGVEDESSNNDIR